MLVVAGTMALVGCAAPIVAPSSPAVPQHPVAARSPVANAAAQSAPRARAHTAGVHRENGYQLGAGDVLKITVYNNPDLTTKTSIGQDGKISFPLIGQIALAGLTPSQAEHRIAHRLSSGGFVRQPYVNVLVSDYRSQTVSVLGNVKNPGAYNISRPLDITQVLAMAGGIDAKGSNVVTLVEKSPGDAARRRKIDITQLIEQGGTMRDPLVRSGDIVYVPPAPVFYIYGEVRNPGAYPLSSGMTVQQALSVGGGLTVRGTENGIELDRKGPHGHVHRLSARLTEQLQPGDVLHVPESWF